MPQLYHFIADQFKENLMLGCQPHQQHMVAGRLCQYLKSWQLDGLRFLYKNYEKGEACILNDESGLGKVVTVSTFLGSILTNDTTKKCLIIVRDDEAIEGWRFHLSVLTHLTVKVIERTSDINFETVYLIKWSTLKNICEMDKVNFDHIIVDNRGEMLNNKFCTGILLRYFENKTTIIISSVDITSDIKLLHILLRLCGRLDRQYTDVRAFEDKFQLPQLKEGVSNKVDLEDYFLKRERVINFCREFRLRRYCHQYDEEFPIVSRSEFQRHLEQWKNQNKNSLSSGSVKLLSSSSEKDTEELFNEYFQVKKERDTHRLDNEVQQINESVMAIDDEDENGADVSDDVVVMSPLLLVSESESDDDQTQIQFERNSQYIEEVKDEDDEETEDDVKITSKDLGKSSSVNRRKSKKPVKTLTNTHLDDSKTLRSRALPSPKRPLPIQTKSRKSAETDKANVNRGFAKRKRSDVNEDKETGKRLKNEETIKKVSQIEKTKVNKDSEKKKSKENLEEKKGSSSEIGKKKSKENQEEKKGSSSEIENKKSREKHEENKASSSEFEKKKSKENQEENKRSSSEFEKKKSKENQEEKKRSSSEFEKKKSKENQEEKKGSSSKREDDRQVNINKDKNSVSEDDKLSKIKKNKSVDKKPEESSKHKESKEADKKSTTSKPKESPKSAQKDSHQATKSEKTKTTQEKQKACQDGRREEQEKSRAKLEENKKQTEVSKKQEKNTLKQLEKDIDIVGNKNDRHQSKDKSKKQEEDSFKKRTKDSNKDDASAQEKRINVFVKNPKTNFSLMFEEAQKFVLNKNIGRRAKKSENTQRRRSQKFEVPKIIVVKTKISTPSPIKSVSNSKTCISPKETKQIASDNKDKSETPKRTVNAKILTELAPLGVHSRSTRGMSRQTRSAVPTSKYMKVAIAQVDITKKSPKTPKRLIRDRRKSIVLVKKISPSTKISKPPPSPTPPVISESPVESMQLGQVLTPTTGSVASDFIAPAPKNNDYHFPLMLDKETSDSECQITSQACNNEDVIVLTGSSTNDCEMEPPKSTVSRRKAFAKLPMVTIHRPMFNKAKSPDLFSTCSDLSLPCSQQQTNKSHFEGFKIFGSELRQPTQPRSCLDILERMLEPRSGIVAGKKNTPTQEKPRSSPHHHCVEDEDAMFEITSNGTFGNTVRVNSNGEMSPIRNKHQSTPPPSGHPKNRITNYLISNSQHTSVIAPTPLTSSLEDPTDLLPKTPKRRKSLSGNVKRSPRSLNSGITGGKSQSTKLTQWLVKNSNAQMSESPGKTLTTKRRRLDLSFPDK